MKIALVLRGLTIGGLERLVLKIAESLTNQHEVTIISTDGYGVWDYKAAEIGADLKVFDVWEYQSIIDYVASISSFINCGKFDAIYFNDTQLGISISPIIHSEMKQLVILHAIDPYSIRKALISSEFIDGYIAISPKTEMILQNYNVNNVALIPNGIKLFPNIKSDNNDTTITFMYCGRISHAEKGVLFLPEIMSKLFSYNILLKVAGDGPDLKSLVDEIEARGLMDSFLYLGVLDEEEVRKEMASSHFLLAPSLSEGFGLSIVEAQSVGCIPVAFHIEGVIDFIIDHDVNGLVCKYKDIADMCQKIEGVIRDPHKYGNMQLQAINNSYKYSITETATRWWDFAMTTQKSAQDTLAPDERYNRVIENLSIASLDDVTRYRDYVIRFFIDGHHNPRLSAISNKKVMLFGTLIHAYYTFTYLQSNEISILGFIDNNRSGAVICGLPVITEAQISDFLDCDVIIITVESTAKHIIKERIEKHNLNIEVTIWNELLDDG